MFDQDVSFRVAGALFEAFSKAKSGGPSVVPQNGPFTIAVSREAGAGGRSVADEIGRRIGWPIYDREILDQVAERMHQPTFRLEGIDERPVHWLEDCVHAFAAQHHISPTRYLNHLIGVVRGLGLIGKCVIVGRGASFILPPETTVRVRLVASLSDRIKVIARRHNLVEREAARWIAKTEHERSEFVRRHFHMDPTNAEHYDLVLNWSRLATAECAQTIIQVLHLFEARNSAKVEPALEAVAVGRPTRSP